MGAFYASATARQAKRMDAHTSSSRRLISFHGAIPSALPTAITHTDTLQGDPPSSFGSFARLSRVSVRLPLFVLRCYTSNMHPAAESLLVCISACDAVA